MIFWNPFSRIAVKIPIGTTVPPPLPAFLHFLKIFLQNPEFVSVHRSNGAGSNPSADEEDRPESVYFKSHLDSDMVLIINLC